MIVAMDESHHNEIQNTRLFKHSLMTHTPMIANIFIPKYVFFIIGKTSLSKLPNVVICCRNAVKCNRLFFFLENCHKAWKRPNAPLLK